MISLISVHVPRTAGSTFNWVLQQIYSNSLYRDYGEESTPEYYEPHKVPEEFTVVHGHFSIEKYQDVYPKAKRITWLRNPIDRLVSLYYYLRKTKRLFRFVESNDSDFQKFVEIDAFHNQMVKHVGLNVLNNFDFVGIQEFYNDDMIYLSELLNWPKFEIPHTNITFSKDYAKTLLTVAENKKLMRIIEKNNSDDFYIYHAAIENRASRTKSHICSMYWLTGMGQKKVSAGEKASIESIDRLNTICGTRVTIQAKVKNTGNVSWEPDGSIRLGNHWLNSDMEIVVLDDGRCTPPTMINVGDSFEAELELKVPDEAGIYYVELDMVKEKYYWFKEKGSNTTIIEVIANKPGNKGFLSRFFRR